MAKKFDPMFSLIQGLSMDLETARGIAHQGECYSDVAAALPSFEPQFEEIDPEDIRQELKEYGAWDTEELADDDENKKRILWIAAANIVEEHGREKI